jgi:RNA polymerase sigma-19 factor, ECF subfamily
MYEPEPDGATRVPLPLAVSEAGRQKLMQYIAKRIPNPADVDDLMQEVFARALGRRAELVEDPIGYLFGIAWNVIADFRKVSGDRRCVVFDSSVVESTAEQPPDAVVGAAAAQEALVSQIDAERAVAKALSQLPATHKKVLLLTIGDGLSYAEAAAELHLSVHTVKKYAYQAKAQIRMMTATPGIAAGGEQP